MKVYACREIEYERVKLKRSKIATRKGKGERGLAVDSRPSIADQNNTSLIFDKLDEIEESIQRNTKCCKSLLHLDSALAATFKCTICLNVMPPHGIVFAGCCDRLVLCVECAEEWYRNSSSCPYCRDEDGVSKRKRARGWLI